MHTGRCVVAPWSQSAMVTAEQRVSSPTHRVVVQQRRTELLVGGFIQHHVQDAVPAGIRRDASKELLQHEARTWLWLCLCVTTVDAHPD